MCECICECSCQSEEIDCSRPEDYEVFNETGWRQVVALFDTGYTMNPKLQYGVIYKVGRSTVNEHELKWKSKDDIRKKPRWKPEVGKYYLFSSSPAKQESLNGIIGRVRHIRETPTGTLYVSDSGTSWRYCWPIPKELREELGE